MKNYEICKKSKSRQGRFWMLIWFGVLCFWSASGFAQSGNRKDYATLSFAGGTGTSSDPYQIKTEAQLAYLNNFVSAMYAAWNYLSEIVGVET
jgi:hypothetical protein